MKEIYAYIPDDGGRSINCFIQPQQDYESNFAALPDYKFINLNGKHFWVHKQTLNDPNPMKCIPEHEAVAILCDKFEMRAAPHKNMFTSPSERRPLMLEAYLQVRSFAATFSTQIYQTRAVSTSGRHF